MELQELFKRLSYGELSALSIGMEGAGAIAEDQQGKVQSHIELALKALHARFILRRGFHTLTIVEGQKSYDLSQLIPDLVKILSVGREDDPLTSKNEAQPFGINRHDDLCGTIQILSHDEILFESAIAGERYTIEYQAGHPALPDPLDLEAQVRILPALEEALQVRVAAGIFSGMSGEAHVAKSVQLMNRYEALCAVAEEGDLAQDDTTSGFDRLRDKGFI